MKRLENKVALITGGARGMGASHVRRFVAEGAKVYFTDLLENEGLKLQEEMGTQAFFMKHNVADEEDWKTVIETIEEAEGKLDILVNNAGISEPVHPLGEITLEHFKKVLDVNLISVFLGLTHALPLLQKSNQASVVNISSLAGKKGVYGMASYTSSKFAVRGLTQTAAAEFGQYNIRVNAVYPGVIRTPIWNGPDGEDGTAALNASIANQPIHRVGEAEDVTNMVLFLASDESLYTTGSDFVIDGGSLLKQ